MRTLLERIQRRTVIRHHVGAQIAGRLLCAAGLDHDLTFVLLEIADDRRCIRTHAGVAGVRKVGRVVQAALPVTVRLIRVAGKEHARVVFAAVQPGKAAFVDLVCVSADGFGKRDGHICQTVSVCRSSGQRYHTGRAVDRRNGNRRAVDLSRNSCFVEVGRVHLELGCCAVTDKGVDTLRCQEIYRLVAGAAAGRRRRDGRGRHIGGAGYRNGFPDRVFAAFAHRTIGFAVHQVEYTLHRKRLGKRLVHVRAQLGLRAVRRPKIQLCTRMNGTAHTIRHGE